MIKTNKFLILSVIALLFFSKNAAAETLLYESISVGTQTAAAGTSTISVSSYNYGKIYGVYTVEGGNIRYRTDGQAPTSTEGILAYIGDAFEIGGITDLRRFKAISTSGTVTLKVLYKKQEE